MKLVGFLAICVVLTAANILYNYVHWSLALLAAGGGGYLLLRYRHKLFGID